MVSVIIPTKNEELNLPRIISSIRKQLYKKIEIIVVDTGSTDNTVQVAKELGVRVYKKGAERSVARNWGATKAKAKYLLFLDADMELEEAVVKECVELAEGQKAFRAITIPERTVGNGFIASVRNFEREMYMGDNTVEVARFFFKDVFVEVGGYDPKLTGPEDYDLPYRVSKKYPIGRVSAYINHHEENISLKRLLQKKYYYANKGAYYAQKHPELVWKQGALLFRKAYIRNWRNFVKHPFLGISFIIIRTLEMVSAVCGYIAAVGLSGFMKTLKKMIVK